jgi:hypothetical protein
MASALAPSITSQPACCFAATSQYPASSNAASTDEPISASSGNLVSGERCRVARHSRHRDWAVRTAPATRTLALLLALRRMTPRLRTAGAIAWRRVPAVRADGRGASDRGEREPEHRPGGDS